MHEFNLPQNRNVGEVFDYFISRLAEICKSNGQHYGGIGKAKEIDGNTRLYLDGSTSGHTVSGPMYYINPHAGEFDIPPKVCPMLQGDSYQWIPDIQTNHVTVTPRIGEPLSEQQVEEIQRGLEEIQRELAGLT